MTAKRGKVSDKFNKGTLHQILSPLSFFAFQYSSASTYLPPPSPPFLGDSLVRQYGLKDTMVPSGL